MSRILIFLCLFSFSAFGFSPYEQYLQSGGTRHVGLIASGVEGKGEALKTALASLNEDKAPAMLNKKQISNLRCFSKELQGKSWVMVYFDYEGEVYLDAVNAFESLEPVQALKPLVQPHPRAGRYGNTWLQMEWICFIAGAQNEGEPSSQFAMVTRVKPEKEMEYRQLHQTVWPGVTDQMVRGNLRNFSIFFTEIGDELYEFFYAEYVGDDAAADDVMNKADPFNQRWWKLTDACQDPLPDASGVWSSMDEVTP